MLKVSRTRLGIGAMGVALGCAALPALAGQTITNDLNGCSATSGPSVLVTVSGFKEERGRIRVQSYPATRAAWLEKGQWLSRIETAVAPRSGRMSFCLPVERAGNYAIAVRHDLDGNGRSGWNDGAGFSNNPALSLLSLKPAVSRTTFAVGSSVTRISVVLNYRQGTRIAPVAARTGG